MEFSTVSVDPRITKSIRINERWKIQLFGEAFHVLNHANVSSVSTTQYTRSTSATTCGIAGTPCLAPSPTFQRPTSNPGSLLGPRILQISAKVSF